MKKSPAPVITPIADEPKISWELGEALEKVGFPFPKDDADWLPTHNEAQRWLRVALAKEMEVQGRAGSYSVYVYGSEHGYIYKHTQKENNQTTFATYEEAQEAGMLTMFDLF